MQTSKWMSLKLSPANKAVPMNQLCLPGTHDSAAYTFDTSPTLPANVNLRRLCRWVPFVLPIVKKWSQTQRSTVLQQLRDGVRYIDLRVSFLDNAYWCSHTIATVPLQTVLDDMVTFASEEPAEVVVCDISLDYANRASMTKDAAVPGFWDLLAAHPVSKCCYAWPTTTFAFPSYNAVQTAKKSVLLLTDSDLYNDAKHPATKGMSAPSSTATAVFWNNCQTAPENTIKDLRRLLESIPNSSASKLTNNVLYVWEETLTPNASTIVPPEVTFVIGLIASFLSVAFVIMLVWIVYRGGRASSALEKHKKWIGVFMALVLLGWVVYITRLLSKCPNSARSVQELSQQVRGRVTGIFSKDASFCQFMSVIRTDFADTAFVGDVVALNTTTS